MPAIPELAQPLTDGVVSVRLSEERDIPEILIAYQDDPRLHERLGQERPPSGAQLGSQAESSPADRAAGRFVALTILEPGSDVCRGQVNVHHIDWANARAELGLWLAPQARGRGLARGALALVARWLFEACGLERVAVLTEPDNERMIRAAQAAGFAYEGVLRSYSRERRGRVDNAVLSLLPSDICAAPR